MATKLALSNGGAPAGRSQPWRHALILVTYVAHVLTPVVHSASSTPEDCAAGCRYARGTGNSLWSPCESSPCDNPRHHHHGSHDADHCVVCQSVFTAHTAAFVASLTCGHEPKVGDAALPSIAPLVGVALGSHLIRGPPLATVS
jgi:hypothetical protein